MENEVDEISDDESMEEDGMDETFGDRRNPENNSVHTAKKKNEKKKEKKMAEGRRDKAVLTIDDAKSSEPSEPVGGSSPGQNGDNFWVTGAAAVKMPKKKKNEQSAGKDGIIETLSTFRVN